MSPQEVILLVFAVIWKELMRPGAAIWSIASFSWSEVCPQTVHVCFDSPKEDLHLKKQVL